MKKVMKITIVLGVALVFCGALAGCKEKSEEEKVEELVEKLGEAKTEKEVEKIANKIEKIKQRAEKKHIEEINVKLGEPFSIWQYGLSSSDPQKRSKFQVILKDTVVDKFYPYPVFARVSADRGKKYFGIVMEIENLGPRKSILKQHIEVKVNNGFAYRLAGTMVDNMFETLEPSQTGVLQLLCQIPEDTYPVEVFGKLGEGSSYYAPGYTKFRLKLTQAKKETHQAKKITERQIEATKAGIAGDYIIVTKMPSGQELKSPGLLTLKENGTELSNLSGKWEISGDQLKLKFCDQDEFWDDFRFEWDDFPFEVEGQITTDAIRYGPSCVNLRKQRGAKVIKRIGTRSILWSKYYFTGDRANTIKSVSLEIKEHGTFQGLTVVRNTWRIKDGGVEITIADENQKEKKLKGEIERDTIMFQDGETEFRYVKQD